MQEEFKLISRQPDTGAVPEYLSPDTAAAVRRFHESFPQYAPTPLVQLRETARLLFISTEGDTDKENYRKIVWEGRFPGA